MKNVAIAYSKLRDTIGLVGGEIRISEKNAYVKLVRQWDSKDINQVAPDIAALYQKFKWDSTIIQQETGEYLINSLRKEYHIPLKVITTQKKVKEPKEIQKIRVMDKIEMTEFLRKLKLNNQIKFPEKTTTNMQKLEAQMPFFAKHTTEAGGIDYYAPGEEPDDLVTALMIFCFSGRRALLGDDGIAYAGVLDGGSEKNITNMDVNMEIDKQMAAAFPSGGFGYNDHY